MKNLAIILLLLINCNKYDEILNGLSKNYVLLHDQIDINLYNEYFESNKIKYSEDVSEYNNAIKSFYNSETDIIDCLIKYENDHEHLCNWIITKDPYSSKITTDDFITKSKGSLILIDNFLLDNRKKIIIPTYMNKLTYEKFKIFYKKNKKKNKKDIKISYEKFIKSL